jgi:hypothetical protein
MRSLPIRLKLTLWYTGITCLTFLAAALALYFSIRVTVQRNAVSIDINLQMSPRPLARRSTLPNGPSSSSARCD